MNNQVRKSLLSWSVTHSCSSFCNLKQNVFYSKRCFQVDYLERPESHPEYWNAISLYVMQAKNDKARKLLSVHADFNSDHFASIDELLRKMPIYITGKG
jgi:hypothetical protein